MREVDLTEKEKKIVGQRIVYIDYLFTNAIREYGLTDLCYTVLYDLLAQMITLANAVGVNVVTLEDLENCIKEYFRERRIYIYHTVRARLYELRAKLIAECVRQGVIESFKEIPIGIEYNNEDNQGGYHER